MQKFILYSLFFILFAGTANAACSRADLARCLDSACAINIGANPAARCQYCGTSSAGTPTVGMKSLAMGNTKIILSDTELKSAPTDQGARYAWATGECIKRVADCTADDATKFYDYLIEQSCRAANVNYDIAAATASANKTKSRAVCETEITSCLINEKRCTANFGACENNAEFDRYFSDCSVVATGCDAFIGELRTATIASRDNAMKNSDELITRILNTVKTNRENKIQDANDNCINNTGHDKCIANTCANNMSNKCVGEFSESEKSMANELCGFWTMACGTLK